MRLRAGRPARRWRDVRVYAAVGLMAGSLIALQLAIMRIFAVGSWAHFGSLVVSLAMLGFGLTSAVLCVVKSAVERHSGGVAAAALILFAPLLAGANLCAQQVPFNAVFMLADPGQRWRLLANFVLYLLPFLAGALFLGVVFIRNRHDFSRIYFADLTGAGLGGAAFFLSMYVIAPENLILVPLALGASGAALWFSVYEGRGTRVMLALALVVALGVHYGLPAALHIPVLAVSDYKGVAYARKFPDSERVYRDYSPFGDLQIYASSYLHFAPGLSDNAAFNLPPLPKDSFLGLYTDGDGPVGVMRDLPAEHMRYFEYLPMDYPYLIKDAPSTFIVQFGGGISTLMALRNNARAVTIAERNPAVIAAFSNDAFLKGFTGGTLASPQVRIVGQAGRLFLNATPDRYDIVDLSLTDSFGLSSPGGFSVTESFAYTREAMQRYMRALAPGGILAVTVWNKEEPPKSVVKLYATLVDAARAEGIERLDRSFFVFANYLSTATVLFKNGGFTEPEIRKLRDHTAAMSFDEIYYPRETFDLPEAAPLLASYREQVFGSGAAEGLATAPPPPGPAADATLPATSLGRLVWRHLIRGDWDEIAGQYVFDTRPLTDDRPYFAGYIKPGDLPRVIDRLEVLQDEWGYLLLWVTLGVAVLGALLLVALPAIFGGRALFLHGASGTFGTIVYFACLGLGYIAVEVGLLSKFVLALSHYTIAAAVVVPAMLVLSGIGSLIAGRCINSARRVLPALLVWIAISLTIDALWIDAALDRIGSLPTWSRAIVGIALLAPSAIAMGFPMPIAMTALARLGKNHMFVWAWGINGCFSVVGAALVPILATAFGLSASLALGAVAYLVALPAVFAVLQPRASVTAPVPASVGTS